MMLHTYIMYVMSLQQTKFLHLFSTLCGFLDMAQTKFLRSRSLQQGLISNRGHTMMLHTYDS